MFNKQIIRLVKDFLEDYIQPGMVCVDLTAGNGNDTCFLASKIGNDGIVYAFDVQKEALSITEEKLKQLDLKCHVKLIHDGHEHIKKYVTNQVQIAMMNLGYLPGGDKRIITTASSTLSAIRDTFSLMAIGGVMSIVSYFGHEGGLSELQALTDFLVDLDPKTFEIIRIDYPNRSKNAPIIFFIQKKACV